MPSSPGDGVNQRSGLDTLATLSHRSDIRWGFVGGVHVLTPRPHPICP